MRVCPRVMRPAPRAAASSLRRWAAAFAGDPEFCELRQSRLTGRAVTPEKFQRKATGSPVVMDVRFDTSRFEAVHRATSGSTEWTSECTPCTLAWCVARRSHRVVALERSKRTRAAGELDDHCRRQHKPHLVGKNVPIVTRRRHARLDDRERRSSAGRRGRRTVMHSAVLEQ